VQLDFNVLGLSVLPSSRSLGGSRGTLVVVCCRTTGGSQSTSILSSARHDT